MDLNDLDHWTRRALEAEAQRRGIRDPHLRTRTGLIRLLLRKAYGDPVGRGRRRLADGLSAIKRARELVGAVVEVAAETLGRTSAGDIETPLPESLAPEPGPAGHGPGPAEAPPERAPISEATERRPTSEPTERRPTSEPTERRFEREPIRTHSMARLLAHQGYRERSLAIYEELLARHTDDPTLLREARLVRGGGDLDQIPGDLPQPPPVVRSGPTVPDEIRCDTAADRLSIAWRVTEDGAARAEAVLGKPGELAVRLVSIRPDPETVVRTTITEYGPVGASGTWQPTPELETDGMPVEAGPAGRCFVAVGLRAQDRFVSIAHTQPA